jgi:hypothetical protein
MTTQTPGAPIAAIAWKDDAYHLLELTGTRCS